MFTKALLGIAGALGLGSFFLQKNRPLHEKVKAGDSIFLPLEALEVGVPGSATSQAELTVIKTLNTGKKSIRVDDVIPDSKGTKGHGIILPTPSSPSAAVRFDLKAITGIERPDDRSAEGFVSIT